MPSPKLQKVINAAKAQTGVTRFYAPGYSPMAYPGGDVPKEKGVCPDVLVRAFRAGGVDLQKAVHEDMKAHFGTYPCQTSGFTSDWSAMFPACPVLPSWLRCSWCITSVTGLWRQGEQNNAAWTPLLSKPRCFVDQP